MTKMIMRRGDKKRSRNYFLDTGNALGKSTGVFALFQTTT